LFGAGDAFKLCFKLVAMAEMSALNALHRMQEFPGYFRRLRSPAAAQFKSGDDFPLPRNMPFALGNVPNCCVQSLQQGCPVHTRSLRKPAARLKISTRRRPGSVFPDTMIRGPSPLIDLRFPGSGDLLGN
jgi:hypothetical protein